MSSSLVLKGLSSVGGNLISLDMCSCGVKSATLESLFNLTSLHSLNLYGNQLTNTIPKSLGNLCNLRHIDMGGNNFQNISLTSLLESFFDCKSPSLESLSLESSTLSSFLPGQLGQLINLVHLQLGNNHIAGPNPDSIGRLSFLKSLDLDENLISGPIPYSVGGLSSLELLELSNNQLTDTLPKSLGQLSKLNTLDLSHNLLKGVVTDSHFSKLIGLKYLNGRGNNLTLRSRHVNWVPAFHLETLYISSWDLGPQFPLWLLMQRDLELLEMSNTKISSAKPKSFWRSFVTAPDPV
ncbi:putative non-specific serine/threonine protein kinase [Helianthus annuus]|uniref:Non-specific serine/threonine protein kinase n=2 Tax=Helianthus annuus TaxID=4232 RepID=A0A9K3IPU6_HELAN|nr:putative non-specific serine/threonine protein kinase [Helianthus annuus]